MDSSNASPTTAAVEPRPRGWCLLVVNVCPELPQVAAFGLEGVVGTNDVAAAGSVVLIPTGW